MVMEDLYFFSTGTFYGVVFLSLYYYRKQLGCCELDIDYVGHIYRNVLSGTPIEFACILHVFLPLSIQSYTLSSHIVLIHNPQPN